MNSHPDLPSVRFYPNGFISETSPDEITVSNPYGDAFTLALSADRMYYAAKN